MQNRAVDKRDFVHKRRIFGVKKGKNGCINAFFQKTGIFWGKSCGKLFKIRERRWL